MRSASTEVDNVPPVKITDLAYPYHHFLLQHDLNVKLEARGFKTQAKNVVTALTERVKQISLEKSAGTDQQQQQEQDKKQDNWKPIGSVPGITQPHVVPEKKVNLETQLKTLERNCRNMHQKQDFTSDKMM